MNAAHCFLAISVVGIAVGSADAAITVFGSGEAVACYDAAEGRTGYVPGAKSCRTALDTLALSRDQRAATYVNYGIVLMHLARPHDALRQYQVALDIDDKLGAAWVNRGIARWHGERDAAAALADLDRGIALGTTDPHVAHYVRGVVNERLGRLQQAYVDYMRAAELAPEWDMPKAELARFSVQPAGR